MNTKINLKNHKCTSNLCKEYSETEGLIVVQNNGRKYELINDLKLQISKYDLDDCVLKNHGKIGFKLCDNVFVFENIYIWIELKGADLNHAAEQIYNSYKNAIDFPKGSKHFARIILSKVNKPDINKTYVKKLKSLFYQNFIHQTR